MITTAHVYSWLFIHVGVILVVAAYYAVGAAILPGMTARSADRFARRPWLPALVGVVVSVPWVLLASVLLGQGGPVAALGGMLIGSWILIGLIGGAGIAMHVGGLGAGEQDRPVGWATVTRGGLLIALTWVLPIVGWLVMLPLTIASGLGCLLLGLVPRRSTPVTPVAAPLPAPVAGS